MIAGRREAVGRKGGAPIGGILRRLLVGLVGGRGLLIGGRGLMEGRLIEGERRGRGGGLSEEGGGVRAEAPEAGEADGVKEGVQPVADPGRQARVLQARGCRAQREQLLKRVDMGLFTKGRRECGPG